MLLRYSRLISANDTVFTLIFIFIFWNSIVFCDLFSLVSETIPYHRDYQALHPKERANYMKVSLIYLYFFLQLAFMLSVLIIIIIKL